MSDRKPGRGSDQFPLRLPDGMRERIKVAAEANGRSMNAEIIARIEATLQVTEKNIAVKDVLPSLFSIYEGLEEGIDAILDRLDRLESQIAGTAPKPGKEDLKPSGTESPTPSPPWDDEHVAPLLDKWISRQPDPKPTRDEALTSILMQGLVKPEKNSNDDVLSQGSSSKGLSPTRPKRQIKL